MKRIVKALHKQNWGKRVYAVFALCATTTIALPAQTFTTLSSFDGTDGNRPLGALVQATNGNLYGTTYVGGANFNGTVFKITPSGALTNLFTFDGTDGEGLTAGIIQATDGNFYGTAGYGGHGYGTVFKITPSGADSAI